MNGSIQRTFLGADFGWEWIENGAWYKWDFTQGNRDALKARNAEAKRLQAEGWKVRKSSNTGNLISRGGIGSGQAHIEVHCNSYTLDAYKI